MILKFLKILKKFVLAGLIMYAYNILALPLSVLVPINFITIVIVFCFDFVGLFGLILFKYLFF